MNKPQLCNIIPKSHYSYYLFIYLPHTHCSPTNHVRRSKFNRYVVTLIHIESYVYKYIHIKIYYVCYFSIIGGRSFIGQKAFSITRVWRDRKTNESVSNKTVGVRCQANRYDYSLLTPIYLCKTHRDRNITLKTRLVMNLFVCSLLA